MASVSSGELSGEKKGWLGQLCGRQRSWLKLGFPEPVSGLQIQCTDGSHSFLIGTKLRGAGWLCCLAWLSGGPGGSWYQGKSLCWGGGRPAFLKQHGVVQGAPGSESLALTWGSGSNPGFGVRESPPVFLFILSLRCLSLKWEWPSPLLLGLFGGRDCCFSVGTMPVPPAATQSRGTHQTWTERWAGSAAFLVLYRQPLGDFKLESTVLCQEL